MVIWRQIFSLKTSNNIAWVRIFHTFDSCKHVNSPRSRKKSQHGCGRWAPTPCPLFWCPNVQVSQCPGVLVSWCPSVLVSQYPGVPVSQYHSVPVSQCPFILVAPCPGVPVSQCTSVPVTCGGQRNTQEGGRRNAQGRGGRRNLKFSGQTDRGSYRAGAHLKIQRKYW